MLGHETMKMILERYYSYVKNYQWEAGSAFMESVYLPGIDPMDETEYAPDLSMEK